MSFKELNLKHSYSSERDDLLNDFYIPILQEARFYRRITGFFSSSSFYLAAKGLSKFIINEGKMQFIINVQLSPEDYKQISIGTNQPEKLIEKLFIKELEDLMENDTAKVLGYLIANNYLEIKVGYIKNQVNQIDILHQKVGILEDIDKNIVTFSGSNNESAYGWKYNSEKFKVFYSWEKGIEAYLQQDLNDFKELWENTSPKTAVISFPQAVKDKLIKIRAKNKNELKEILNKLNKDKVKNENLQPKISWKHQFEAKSKFLKKNKGILEMATGTGKTRTAIGILKTLYENDKIDGAIISTFGNDLLDQWYNELLEHAADFTIYRYYHKYNELSDFFINPNKSILIVSWQNLNNSLVNKACVISKLFIIDEIHGFGSKGLREKLKDKLKCLKYTLGLSATPERDYDEKGNQFIEEEIGPTIFRYGLSDAIKEGILCSFDYIPLEYYFSVEDKKKIKNAYSKYSSNKKKGMNEKAAKKQLYLDLSNVRKLSKTKLPNFEKFIKNNYLKKCIIFVGTKKYGKLVQDILIHKDIAYHTYYGEDDAKNLEEFANNKFDLLITCQKLSQGIDIKSIENIILFSASRSKLETIQRIGRCLRTDPNNLNKQATVIDFILSKEYQKSYEDHEDSDYIREKWLTKISKIRR